MPPRAWNGRWSIPINMTGRPYPEIGVMQDRRRNLFSIPVLGVSPGGYTELRIWNDQEDGRERVRLWYVATTRARDFLILPHHSAKLPDGCWANIVDLNLKQLLHLDPQNLGEGKASAVAAAANSQTRETFATEAGRIREAMHTVVWTRPSRGELDFDQPTASAILFDSTDDAEEATEIPVPSIAGSSQRGIILHKLMEEVFSGETSAAPADLQRRATELLGQLGVEPKDDPQAGISPAELAATVEGTFKLPEIAQLRERLVPEHSIFGRKTTPAAEILVSGIADAVAPDAEGGIEVVIDWKSDVDPSAAMIAHYRKQIDEYRMQTGAKRALLVLMTAGKVIAA